jgi:hypothetical protein
VSLRIIAPTLPQVSMINHSGGEHPPPLPPGVQLLPKRRLMSQQTFKTITAALLESQLSVSEFFGLLGYSLSYGYVLSSITHLASTTTVFSSLKKLTVRLSSIRISFARFPATYGQSAHGTNLLQRLLVMLSFMPHLEKLDAHWYNFGDLYSNGTLDLDVTVPLELPRLKLKDCSLRGLFVPEEDLLRYLKAVRPTNLTLTDIRLVPGSWTSIFDYLSSSISPITSYHLDDLCESGELLVHFDGVPGQSKFAYDGVQMGPSALTRQMAEVGEPIRYQTTSRPPFASPERERWSASKMLEFGALR